jgi:hypothetical protein
LLCGTLIHGRQFNRALPHHLAGHSADASGVFRQDYAANRN